MMLEIGQREREQRIRLFTASVADILASDFHDEVIVGNNYPEVLGRIRRVMFQRLKKLFRFTFTEPDNTHNWMRIRYVIGKEQTVLGTKEYELIVWLWA